MVLEFTGGCEPPGALGIQFGSSGRVVRTLVTTYLSGPLKKKFKLISLKQQNTAMTIVRISMGSCKHQGDG